MQSVVGGEIVVLRDSEHVAQSLGAILVERFVRDCKVFTDRLSTLSDEFKMESRPKHRVHSYMGHIDELHALATQQFRGLTQAEESRIEESDPVMRALVPFRSAKELLGATRLRLLELEESSSRASEFESAFQEASAHLHDLYCDARTAFAGIFDAVNSDDHDHIVAIEVKGTHPEWTEEKNMRRCDLIDKDIAGSITVVEQIELNQLQREAIAYRDRVAPLPMAGALKLHAELLSKKQEADAISEE